MRKPLFPAILGMEARRMMAYSADFWISTFFGSAATVAVAYFLWQAMFRESGSTVIGGYSFEGMVAYYVLAVLLGRLVRCNDMTGLSDDVYKGEYTRYIIYPTSFFRFKYAQHLAGMLSGLVQAAVFALPVVWLLGTRAFDGISPVTVAMTVLTVLAAHLLLFVMRLPIHAVAFWADNVWSLTVMLRMITSFLGGAMVPLVLFPEWGQAILAWLPFRLLFHVPVMTITGKVDPTQWAMDLGLALAWTSIIGLIGHAVWRRGDRVYTGVGI